MPERVTRLKALLQELETELRSLDTLDDESKEALETTLAEVHTALGKQESGSLEPESLIQRLRAAEDSFQVTHPNLSGIVLRMIDALGQLGI